MVSLRMHRGYDKAMDREYQEDVGDAQSVHISLPSVSQSVDKCERDSKGAEEGGGGDVKSNEGPGKGECGPGAKSGKDGENPSPFPFSALPSLRHHSEVKFN